MKSSIENIHLSQTAKDQLIKLKRLTGLDQWNILCRWALLFSLADASEPTVVKIPADSNLEMTWKTFSGNYGEIIQALLVYRFRLRNSKGTDMATYFRLHLHRGISSLANRRDVNSVEKLFTLLSLKD